MVGLSGSCAVRTRLLCVVSVTVALLSACSLFGAHPFPDYLSGVSKQIDISARIGAVLKTAVSARYEIATVSTAQGERVLVLVDPAVTEPTAGSPTPVLLIFDETLDYLASVVPVSPLGYVGRPYTLAADGNVFSGDTVFDPTSGAVSKTLSPTGLAGFGFSAFIGATPMTVVVSLPAGESASNMLTIDMYDSLSWVPQQRSVNIVSDLASSPGRYLLEGARLESDGDTLTLVLRDSQTDVLSVVHTSLAAVAAQSAPPLMDSSPVSTMDGTAATVYLTDGDIMIRRTTGSFERYNADGTSMSSQVTSDRRTGLVYAFSRDGTYLYRLDPATGSFLLIRAWW